MKLKKITVEFRIASDNDNGIGTGWCVTHGDKYADSLGYDECLGLLATLIVPEEKNCLQWLRTAEEHKHRRESWNSK